MEKCAKDQSDGKCSRTSLLPPTVGMANARISIAQYQPLIHVGLSIYNSFSMLAAHTASVPHAGIPHAPSVLDICRPWTLRALTNASQRYFQRAGRLGENR